MTISARTCSGASTATNTATSTGPTPATTDGPPRRPSPATVHAIAREEDVLAATYAPLPVVLRRGEGAWVEDIDGVRYLDALAGYSALNFGHSHPGLVQVAQEQIARLTLSSRAFHNDQLGPFAEALAELCGMSAVLPMNTGAEAVETAIKLARKWGYERRHVAPGEARIVVAADNFHGRTTTIVGFSTDATARDGFGPYAPGFDIVPFGDIDALGAAITPQTVAVLLEPIQGEAGVIIPPEGYLAAVREITAQRDVLFIADEVQSGLGRTGRTFACDHEGITPDVLVLGKALGGGILPVSAVVTSREIMSSLRVGEHGSTFGGNPLAAAVGRAVVALLADDRLQANARRLEPVLREGLGRLHGAGVVAHRVRGLWAGIDIDPELATGRRVCEELLARGVLAKETHGSTLRLALPLIITEAELGWLLDVLADSLDALTKRRTTRDT